MREESKLDIHQFIISENMPINEAASIMDKNAKPIIFICESEKLLAALSDGDIRRHVKQNGNLLQPVKSIANYHVCYLPIERQHEALEVMRSEKLKAIPVVNEDHKIVSIKFDNMDEARRQIHINTPVVIMAGGKGTRLKPYTYILPKPLIPIGETTITERIIHRFAQYGCHDFTMIVNYRKEIIKAYFNEAIQPYLLSFVEEPTYRGTGGGLKLLENKINDNFFMTNCDVLIDADYDEILRYHMNNKNIITMVCACKKVSVPYGTVLLNKNGIPEKFIEKPEYPLLINTGLYVINPVFLRFIPSESFIHITDTIQQCIDNGEKVGTCTVGENDFMDMGQLDELEKMRSRLEIV